MNIRIRLISFSVNAPFVHHALKSSPGYSSLNSSFVSNRYGRYRLICSIRWYHSSGDNRFGLLLLSRYVFCRSYTPVPPITSLLMYFDIVFLYVSHVLLVSLPRATFHFFSAGPDTICSVALNSTRSKKRLQNLLCTGRKRRRQSPSTVQGHMTNKRTT